MIRLALEQEVDAPVVYIHAAQEYRRCLFLIFVGQEPAVVVVPSSGRRDAREIDLQLIVDALVADTLIQLPAIGKERVSNDRC